MGDMFLKKKQFLMLIFMFSRQDSSPSSLPALVAGSSALLGALAVSILTPGSFPTTTTKATSTKNLPRCPTNWKDATHVGLGCVWAGTKGGGVRSIQQLSDNQFWVIFEVKIILYQFLLILI